MSHLESSQTATDDQTCQHETFAARSTICSVVGRKDSRGLEVVSKATAQALGHCVPPADTVSHLHAAQHLSVAVQPDIMVPQHDIHMRIGRVRLHWRGLCVADVHCPHHQIGAPYGIMTTSPLQADQLEAMHACAAGVEGQVVLCSVGWGGFKWAACQGVQPVW